MRVQQPVESTMSTSTPDRMAADRLLKPWTPRRRKVYIFKNANIVDPVVGKIVANATARLVNGLIDNPSDTFHAHESTQVQIVDLQGRYLCPGLIDSHVHLTAVPSGRELSDVVKIAPDRSKMRQPWVCQQILRRGFTTVRDCGGATLALKEAIADGVFPGPRLFIAGHALSQTGGHGDFRGAHDPSDPCGCGAAMMGLARICDGVAECLKSSREELRMGADFLKIMAGGGVASPTDALDHVQFSAEEVRAITTVASSHKTYVTAHAYTPESIQHAINNGVKGIEHGNLIDEETAALMAERDAFLTPTLVTYSEMASDRWEGFLPPESAAKNAEVLQAGLRSLEIASRAGVTMCYGTDLLGAQSIAQTKEFKLRAQVLSAVELLRSATINPARMLGQADRLGQIQPGFVADLLVLNRNPLEDITVFDDPDRHLLAVIKDGWVQVSRWSVLPQDYRHDIQTIE